MSKSATSTARRIRTAEPHAEFLALRAEILQAVERVFDAGHYILGPEVAAFESEFAAFTGSRHGIGVASGTAALELALRALSIGPGDAVFTVSHTSVATVAAIELVGATPVLIDIDPASYTMDVADLEAALDRFSGPAAASLPKPRAILPVHIYGHPADMPAISRVAARYGLRIVEDCSQAHGARIGSKAVGTFGDAAAFSLYPTKNLGAIGDGGIITTDDDSLAERLRKLRQYGWDRPQNSTEPGTNSRLDELQAAILRVKLSGLEAANARRRQIAARYDAGLAGSGIVPPAVLPDITHAYHQYVIRANRRELLRERLANLGVDAGVHYPLPVHRQPAYAGRLLSGPRNLSTTDSVSAEILSLPAHPNLTDDEAGQVLESVLVSVLTDLPG